MGALFKKPLVPRERLQARRRRTRASSLRLIENFGPAGLCVIRRGDDQCAGYLPAKLHIGFMQRGQCEGLGVVDEEKKERKRVGRNWEDIKMWRGGVEVYRVFVLMGYCGVD